METNETALFDKLLQMAEVLERTVQELERVRGALFENEQARERYLVMAGAVTRLNRPISGAGFAPTSHKALLAGSTWEVETNSKQGRATKPSPRIATRDRPGGQVNERVVIEENACTSKVGARGKSLAGGLGARRAVRQWRRPLSLGKKPTTCTKRAPGARGTTLSEEATQSKLGRSGGPAVDGISGEDQCLRDQGQRGMEATGLAHGPVVARKEGNASGAKGPWVGAGAQRTPVGTLWPRHASES
jgi:hypothetical protein